MGKDGPAPRLQGHLGDDPPDPSLLPTVVEPELVGKQGGPVGGPEDPRPGPPAKRGRGPGVLVALPVVPGLVPSQDEPDHVVRTHPVIALLVHRRDGVVGWGGHRVEGPGHVGVEQQAGERSHQF